MFVTEQPNQLKIRQAPSKTVIVAVSTLALGGAERIVLDWARRTARTMPVAIIVFRSSEHEYEELPGVTMIRLNGEHNEAVLREKIAKLGCHHKTVLCHILRHSDRVLIAKVGLNPIPVLQNASSGWVEDYEAMRNEPKMLVVSNECQQSLIANNYKGVTEVVRHMPQMPANDENARDNWRTKWRIPKNAIVVGMIGATKPQKNYCKALEVIAELNKTKLVYLVIIGGKVGKFGKETWDETVNKIYQLGLRNVVAMPGPITDAVQCIPAFDVFLNTSHYEGFSMAIMEALLSDVPVVASNVGGQSEVRAEGYVLVEPDAPIKAWVSAIDNSVGKKPNNRELLRVQNFKLWTLMTLVGECEPSESERPNVLFVTQNVNSGGAQRSLVNLLTKAEPDCDSALAVLNTSTTDGYINELKKRNINMFQVSASKDPFDQTIALLDYLATDKKHIVCFWNVDPKVKLLMVKALHGTGVKVVDVSPGNHAISEMDAIAPFQWAVGFDESQYYKNLSAYVTKYDCVSPAGCKHRHAVIPNGVEIPKASKSNYKRSTSAKIAVVGRIAPSKFIGEIVQAVHMVSKQCPDVSLEIHGTIEPRHAKYDREVMAIATDLLGDKVKFCGETFDAQKVFKESDIAVVIGYQQGCPNTTLEALSVGTPVVANNDGGTKEQVIHQKTGLLIESREPDEIAGAIQRLLTDEALREKLGKSGRMHVTKNFSFTTMGTRYSLLFSQLCGHIQKSLPTK